MSSNINIGEFVREIANASASDLPALRMLQGKLFEIKAVIPTVNHPELGFMLDAAADLLRYLAEGQQPTANAMLTMVTRLLVNSECSMYRNLEVLSSTPIPAVPGAPSAPSAPSTAPMGTLKMDSGATIRGDTNDLGDMRIGQFLVQLGVVDASQVTEALGVQRTEKLRLGEALTKLGHIAPMELKDALGLREKMQSYATEQSSPESLRDCAPAPKLEMDEWHESLLGSLLVSSESVTQEQLDEGLSIQKATGIRLGEALVQHGFCGWPEVRAAIRAQESLRHIAKPLINLNTPPAAGSVQRKWA